MNTIIENTKKVISEVDALVADLEAKKFAIQNKAKEDRRPC